MAEFIGTMNLLPGSVGGIENGRISVDGGPLGRWTAAAPDQPLRLGAPVHLALRPERLRFALSGKISGKLLSVAYLGDRSHYLVGVDGLDAPITVFRSNAGRDEIAVQPGQPVHLAWDDHAALVLAS